MAITASAVKELRERTGVGMMECKKALEANGGDMEAAADWLRKQGLAKAVKKEGRITAEGRLAMARAGKRAVLVEVNCETDFVAKDENFVRFCEAVAAAALAGDCDDPDAIRELPLAEGTVEQARTALVAKIGENIQLRRAVRLTGETFLGAYLHGSRIGALVSLSGGDEELARDLAMHVAAANPLCLDRSGLPSETLAKEREIALAKAAESGKPENILGKIADNAVQKFVDENTLLGQAFVKDPSISIGKLVKGKGAEIKAFLRIAVGEGIEKKSENFAEEVRKQVEATRQAEASA